MNTIRNLPFAKFTFPYDGISGSHFRDAGFESQQSHAVTSVNDQLDAQFFYLIIRLLQTSTCFEQRRADRQAVKLY